MVKEQVNNSIGIIGCGWLGKALAKQLQTQNYNVKVTVRSAEKQALLIDKGYDCECLTIVDGVLSSNAIFSQHTLIIAITPGFKRGLSDYANNIANTVTAAKAGSVERIILISSTGIYQHNQGDVDEDSHIEMTQSDCAKGVSSPNDKVSLLAKAEQAVINFNQQSKVVRFSGLVAEDRKPGKFLAGKTELAGAQMPVNLIHRDDCIGLLCELIKNESLLQQIFIGVSQTTANKKAFYTAAANALNLTPPQFKSEALLTHARKVYGEKTRQWLNYQYQHDDLLTWLTQTDSNH